ncbi:MAG: hypothetical protein NZ898_16165 [Myxococcota bacterium]|nr:hypothetical protein [Myxococcota bacterium]
MCDRIQGCSSGMDPYLAAGLGEHAELRMQLRRAHELADTLSNRLASVGPQQIAEAGQLLAWLHRQSFAVPDSMGACLAEGGGALESARDARLATESRLTTELDAAGVRGAYRRRAIANEAMSPVEVGRQWADRVVRAVREGRDAVAVIRGMRLENVLPGLARLDRGQFERQLRDAGVPQERLAAVRAALASRVGDAVRAEALRLADRRLEALTERVRAVPVDRVWDSLRPETRRLLRATVGAERFDEAMRRCNEIVFEYGRPNLTSRERAERDAALRAILTELRDEAVERLGQMRERLRAYQPPLDHYGIAYELVTPMVGMALQRYGLSEPNVQALVGGREPVGNSLLAWCVHEDRSARADDRAWREAGLDVTLTLCKWILATFGGPLGHLAGTVLIDSFQAGVARERAHTARILADTGTGSEVAAERAEHASRAADAALAVGFVTGARQARDGLATATRAATASRAAQDSVASHARKLGEEMLVSTVDRGLTQHAIDREVRGQDREALDRVSAGSAARELLFGDVPGARVATVVVQVAAEALNARERQEANPKRDPQAARAAAERVGRSAAGG